jgi:MFS family permease
MSTKAITRWVVVLTAIGSLMAALDTLVVSTALSTIRLDLGATIEELEWTVNAYNLSFAVLLVTGAALGDRFGRRRLFAVGLGVFAAASAFSALAPSVGWLIAARAVQGAGSALIMPLGLALLSAAFPREKRGAAIGIFSAITGIAVAAGPLVGGAGSRGSAGSGFSGSTSRSGWSRFRSCSPGCGRATARTPASISQGWRWSVRGPSG